MNNRDPFQLIDSDTAGAIIGALTAAIFIFGIVPDVCHAVCKFFH